MVWKFVLVLSPCREPPVASPTTFRDRGEGLDAGGGYVRKKVGTIHSPSGQSVGSPTTWWGVWGLGFGVWGSGCGVWGLGLRVEG